MVSFIVEHDGSLSNFTIVEPSGDDRLDQMLLEFMSGAPAWEPGSLRGQPIRVRYSLPVAYGPFDAFHKTAHESMHYVK